jgi:pSer/pThr/pTyr-binding forkhead associated (FHA) protein
MAERNTFQLEMERGPQPDQTFELPGNTITIGRDPGNYIVINDAQVSRQHARLTPQGGLFIIEDLGSTNGTRVNGIEITSAYTLASGDKINLGENVTLLFHGSPSNEAGATQAMPRTAPPPPPASPPTYEAAPAPAYSPPSADIPEYAEYTDYADEYYDEYETETEYNWAMVGGCLMVAIIITLLAAVFIYFFAPASVIDPIADFLAGLGINVP